MIDFWFYIPYKRSSTFAWHISRDSWLKAEVPPLDSLYRSRLVKGPWAFQKILAEPEKQIEARLPGTGPE